MFKKNKKQTEKSGCRSSRFFMCVLDLVQLGDAVDADLEGRSRLIGRLMVVAISNAFFAVSDPVAVGIDHHGGGHMALGVTFDLALLRIGQLEVVTGNGELAGVEDVQAAGLDGCDGLVNLLLGAGSAGLTERGEGNGIGLIALAPVLIEGLAVHNSAECVLIEDFPNVGRRGQRSIRSNLEHIDVVADAVDGRAGVEGFLAGGRSAGGVGVLADDDAAVGDQSLGSLVLSGDVEQLR